MKFDTLSPENLSAVFFATGILLLCAFVFGKILQKKIIF